MLAQLTRFSNAPICLGANTKSALVVVRGDKVLNKGGLRMPDEYVRHRILDLVGDLMLSGGHVQGKITAVSPAHRLTHELLKKIDL
jgi:UDP-3-O-acyl-N-acetylglucosamine deacetylase